MVQRVYRQIMSVDSSAKVTIATSKSQVSAIRNQLGSHVGICVEPCRRDTFPAIALAAVYLREREKVDETDSVVVCPVDPYVNADYFQALKSLSERALRGEAKLVLMGMEPTYPSEKYGYIIPENQQDVSKVRMFKEKPTRRPHKPISTRVRYGMAVCLRFGLAICSIKHMSRLNLPVWTIFYQSMNPWRKSALTML